MREKDDRSYMEGHRERLRARYQLHGEAALEDYELLELLLTFAIPCRDTKLLARKLLERFGLQLQGRRTFIGREMLDYVRIFACDTGKVGYNN